MTDDVTAPPRPRRRHIWRWVAAGALALLLGIGGWVWGSAQHAVDTATEGHGGAAIDIFIPRSLNNEDTGRVNILLAGNSFDDKGHDGAALTDSIMVASMDMGTKHIALISIPRDLWVEYDGQKMKINAVFPLAASGTQGASGLGDWQKGMDALSGVVETVTGLHIDQHALVGYKALRDVVDAVGGIDVFINSTDTRGIYDPNVDLLLPAGWNHIDGATALKLSRARNHPEPGVKPYGIADGDFGREKNQRMILAALQDKAKTSPALANPAAVVAIFDSISANVRSDLTVSQIRRIYDLGTLSNSTKSISINGTSQETLLRNYSNDSDGASDALVPVAGRYDYTAIRAYVAAACTA